MKSRSVNYNFPPHASTALHECINNGKESFGNGAPHHAAGEFVSTNTRIAITEAGFEPDNTILIAIGEGNAERLQGFLASNLRIESGIVKCVCHPEKDGEEATTFVVISMAQSNFATKITEAIASTRATRARSEAGQSAERVERYTADYNPTQSAAALEREIRELIDLGRKQNVPGFATARLILGQSTEPASPGR